MHIYTTIDLYLQTHKLKKKEKKIKFQIELHTQILNTLPRYIMHTYNKIMQCVRYMKLKILNNVYNGLTNNANKNSQNTHIYKLNHFYHIYKIEGKKEGLRVTLALYNVVILFYFI